MALNPATYNLKATATAAGIVSIPNITGANAPSSPMMALLSVTTVHLLMVAGVGGTPTAWNVQLQGGPDGINWTTILTHSSTNTPPQTSGQSVWNNGGSNQQAWPQLVMYVRLNVVSVTLGAATALNLMAIGRF